MRYLDTTCEVYQYHKIKIKKSKKPIENVIFNMVTIY